MNKECIYTEGKVVVIDENYNHRIVNNSDKLEEILVQENIIETMEKRIKELESKLNNGKKNKYFPVITFSVISTLILFNLISPYFMGGVMTDTIFGSINVALFSSCVAAIFTFPLAIGIDCEVYSQYKKKNNKLQGNSLECEYLKKQIWIEKEKLEELRKEQSLTSDTQELKSEKVDDLKRLIELRYKLSLYNSLGYNMDKYYRYYHAGKLEEKLSGQYDESSINEIMEYFETKDSYPVKKKCRKK